MLQFFIFTIIFNLFFSSPTLVFGRERIQNNSINEALNWAEVTATRLVTCYYLDLTGLWIHELAWQSGNTLESLANFVSLTDSSLKYVFHHTFSRTDIFTGGDCYDDHQWWLLAWMQIYNVDRNIKYLDRAARIYDVVSERAWITTQCNGGVQWCPKKAYKNAITNELFLASSMRLHPYATLLGKPSTYYLDWALKEWQWFENSGMINEKFLINDGLSSMKQFHTKARNFFNENTCLNNNQTTWTYNQGVILSGLALLYNATKNSTLITIAQNIADATIEFLTYPDGILKEPCEPKCDGDQQLFKGIFARHLGYLLPYLTDQFHIQKYTLFLQQNTKSLLNTNRCELDGLFDLSWNNNNSLDSCNLPRDTATTSSALDLFIAVSKTQQQSDSSKWILLGLGNCMDDKNVSMANFYKNDVNETTCRKIANQDSGCIAYDYELKCNGIGFCRIRTLSDRGQTPDGWRYEDGNSNNVTRTNKVPLTSCYLKTNML